MIVVEFYSCPEFGLICFSAIYRICVFLVRSRSYFHIEMDVIGFIAILVEDGQMNRGVVVILVFFEHAAVFVCRLQVEAFHHSFHQTYRAKDVYLAFYLESETTVGAASAEQCGYILGFRNIVNPDKNLCRFLADTRFGFINEHCHS